MLVSRVGVMIGGSFEICFDRRGHFVGKRRGSAGRGSHHGGRRTGTRRQRRP